MSLIISKSGYTRRQTDRNRIHKRIKNYRKIKKDNHLKRITEWNFNKTLKWINEILKSRTRNKDVDNNNARWEITCIEWNQMKTSAVIEYTKELKIITKDNHIKRITEWNFNNARWEITCIQIFFNPSKKIFNYWQNSLVLNLLFSLLTLYMEIIL